jgi:hypothetical protein
MSYQAIIGRVRIREHPNAQRLVLGDICNSQIITGLDTKDGELMVFFPSDGRLSEEFAHVNNLYSDASLNKNTSVKGYFGTNRKVRPQKLRGEISEGFACSLKALAKVPGVKSADVQKLKEGSEFTEISGVEICTKFMTTATIHAARVGKKKHRLCIPSFPQHKDTGQLRTTPDSALEGLVFISLKIHGTSGRYSYTKINRNLPLSRFQRVKKWLGFDVKPKQVQKWTRLIGSRRVILDPELPGEGWYKDNSFREEVCQDWHHLLRKGEVVYGEIVGFLPGGKPIMKPGSPAKLGKKFVKQYGEQMFYSYGWELTNLPGFDFYCYRITQVNETGFELDLPYLQMVKRAEELGLKTPPLLYDPIFCGHDRLTNAQHVRDVAKRLAEGPDPIDSRHIREGVVVRIENESGVHFKKEKSFNFKILECIIKDDTNYIDLEESS